MSCTPDHTLSIQRLLGSNGQADWRISSLTDGYIDGVNKTRRVRNPPPKPVQNEIAGRFMDYDFYTRMEKRNAALAEKKREEDKRKAKHLRTMTLMTLNYVKCVVLVLVAFRLCG